MPIGLRWWLTASVGSKRGAHWRSQDRAGRQDMDFVLFDQFIVTRDFGF